MMRLCALVLLFALPCAAHGLPHSERDLPEYTLQVAIDIQTSSIKGIATIPVAKGRELRFHRGRLNLVQASIAGREIAISGRGEEVRILPGQDGMLVIRYEGVLRESSCNGQCSDVIGDKGVFLTGTWYPKPDRMCLYHLIATLPEGFEAVSEAETIEKSARDHRCTFSFEFPHPLDGITLIASDRYRTAKERLGNVEIFAYFFSEDADLIGTYLGHAKQYLKRYDALISAYPYRRFSIVENSLPVGYSMPTYTVLGQAVVRLPFIPETSLGHEILHQWFGNSVYVDYAGGNWAEGLTSFLADHLYEEEKGRGKEYRKGLLIDFASYVNDKNDFPLKAFTTRTDYPSEAIGYGKALMVFQMLEDLLGPERFYESIRYFAADMRFKNASWDDLKRAFERYYGRDLAFFFGQWIDGKGLPDFRLEEVKVRPSGADFEVAFSIRQEGKAYSLDLPAMIYSRAGKTSRLLHLSREKERFAIVLGELPERIALDEEYRVARKLSVDEIPPVVARLLGDEKRIVVLPPTKPEIYDDIVAHFRAKGDRVSEPKGVGFEDLKTHSLVILGADNPIVGSLYGGEADVSNGFTLSIREMPWNRWKVAGIFDGRSKEEVGAAFGKVFHYGKFSQLRFDHGTNVYKSVDDKVQGISRELYKEAAAVDVSALRTLREVMQRVADKKIIYVGESHDLFSHHAMELEIVKDLVRRGRKIAIGMEMFQRPFQGAVDAYIEGGIDEKAFLKGTEYFKRWGFDYGLYRPILVFAKSLKIPVVALNQRREIVDKVFRGGLDSLSEEEKRSMPSGMDFSDEGYRKRLAKAFREHAGSRTENFDFFYQAQVLWDETMSESISQFLRTHPDYQMVVLAGNGHLEYGSGIPGRTARRTPYDYAVILNDADMEKGAADFVLFPDTIVGSPSPRLMVLFKEGAGRAEVTGFPEQSVSQAAGMKVGDVILAIGEAPVQNVDDVKLELTTKKKGDRVRVRVLRKDFVGIPRQMDLNVVLE
jgi:uncharacterized iron-regulated protein